MKKKLEMELEEFHARLFEKFRSRDVRLQTTMRKIIDLKFRKLMARHYMTLIEMGVVCMLPAPSVDYHNGAKKESSYYIEDMCALDQKLPERIRNISLTHISYV